MIRPGLGAALFATVDRVDSWPSLAGVVPFPPSSVSSPSPPVSVSSPVPPISVLLPRRPERHISNSVLVLPGPDPSEA